MNIVFRAAVPNSTAFCGEAQDLLYADVVPIYPLPGVCRAVWSLTCMIPRLSTDIPVHAASYKSLKVPMKRTRNDVYSSLTFGPLSPRTAILESLQKPGYQAGLAA